MKRVYLADPQSNERLAFRTLLQNLKMQVVGEAADWETALAQAPATRPDMVLVEWGLVAPGSGAGLAEMRRACPAAVVIVLISRMDAREQAALSAGADAFVSKAETTDRVVEHLRAAVGSYSFWMKLIALAGVRLEGDRIKICKYYSNAHFTFAQFNP